MKAYQLKMVIKNSKPPIWRRMIIPSGITFSQLSLILNAAMGRKESQVFEFEFYHAQLRIAEAVDKMGSIGYGPFDYQESRNSFIREYLEKNDWFTYRYGEDDNGQHRVTVEKIITDYAFDYPQVIKQVGICPNADYAQTEENYDIQLVNKEFQDKYFYNWGNGEYRFLSDILKEHLSGEYGLNATSQDDNKNVTVIRSGKHQLYEAAQNFTDKLIKEAQKKQAWHKDSLNEIISCFAEDDIREIAEDKGVKGISHCKKEVLIDKLVHHMLQPEVMEQYFLYLRDDEIEAFEVAAEKSEPYQVSEIEPYEKLFQAGYIAMLYDGKIEIPPEVAQRYAEIKGEDFNRKRHDISYLNCCLETVGALYGIAPLSIIKQLLLTNPQVHMSELQLRSTIKNIPMEYSEYILVGDMVYYKEYYPDDSGLLRAQGNKKYYIPTMEEILNIGIWGYNPDSKELKSFNHFLTHQMRVSAEQALSVGILVQTNISMNCKMQDVIDIIEAAGIKIKNDGQFQKLTMHINELWNHTRMLLNRGFMPDEMTAEKKTPLPAENKNKIIRFESEKKKRIYPNDLCPCGSGKKYKHCCGIKEK